MKKWEDAIADAKKCIDLTPSFLKGYYRLATAQMELNQLDNALTTVKKGLSFDIDNSQLLRLQRSIKQKKLNARRDAAASKQQQQQQQSLSKELNKSKDGGRNHLSATANKEVFDLQQQYIASSREYNLVKANLNKSQREHKVNSITISELEKLEGKCDSLKMYRGIGKMFMLSDQQSVMKYLKDGMEIEKKKELDMTSKMAYLEKKMNSQKNNIEELIRAS